MTNKEALEMRLAGATYQEIADTCGITREAVRQKIERGCKELMGNTRGSDFISKIKYQGIYEYFEGNFDMSMSLFAKKVFGANAKHYKTKTMRDFLTGTGNMSFTIQQMQKICEIVGKPFEEVFKERETNDKGEA
ncbi:MAG: sigma factor-like helix-turn-helix DNA-binding protein [Acutalibacteraceae bacterium]|nr:sigma factor-like helix-turn-helix DNA-binding protein [Acutalibacteraceae bacterium]